MEPRQHHHHRPPNPKTAVAYARHVLECNLHRVADFQTLWFAAQITLGHLQEGRTAEARAAEAHLLHMLGVPDDDPIGRLGRRYEPVLEHMQDLLAEQVTVRQDFALKASEVLLMPPGAGREHAAADLNRRMLAHEQAMLAKSRAIASDDLTEV